MRTSAYATPNGPIRPIIMLPMMIILPHALKLAVSPIDSPTVPYAETASNIMDKNEADSVAVKMMTENMSHKTAVIPILTLCIIVF